MPTIFDSSGQEVERTTTVGTLIAARRSNAHSAQVTAESAEESAAAEAAGIEMIVCRSAFVEPVREGTSSVFVTAAIDFSGAVTDDEMLAAAYTALSAGADAIITGRRPETVRRLTDEKIPVMGHLGFIPNKSTWYGGIRAIGKTADEAMLLWDQFRRLEDAGAFGVECELIPAAVMREINRRTGLVTVSLGSGSDADIMFLFSSDICGESERLPRHARAYGDIKSLRQQVIDERVNALTAYRADVAAKTFPDDSENASIDNDELAQLISRMDDDGVAN
ncbi:MAG: 3-methyl-2-oxobutanoate hydroxymethyltransferase [Woeseiaceae bacterium]